MTNFQTIKKRAFKNKAVKKAYDDLNLPMFSEITNINTYSKSFSFLKKEPDIYSTSKIK
ncbi:MAG: hypothetical protein WC908_02690 [Candidatus Paceibacterota bacterium]